MRALVIVLLSIVALSNAQYHWTGAENWNIEPVEDYDTYAYIKPITGWDVDYGYGITDADAYETYGGKTAVAPITYAAASPLQTKTLAPQYETLPETWASPVYAPEVVNTRIQVQPIKMPRVVRQPIVQQRLVEQPIYRTRVVNVPVIRRIVNQDIIRPQITKTSSTKPMYSEQQVVQPKIYEQNVYRQSYSEKQEQRNPIVEAATHTSAKGDAGFQTMAYGWY